MDTRMAAQDFEESLSSTASKSLFKKYKQDFKAAKKREIEEEEQRRVAIFRSHTREFKVPNPK